MQRNPHEGRIGTRQRIVAITASYTFDHRGVCTDHGKYEGCYEATVYFADIALEGDFGEGLISFPDGSSEFAYKITMEERAALAGPWDQVGWPHADYLYIICEGSEGGVRASFSTEADWAQRMSGQDEEELN